VLDTKMRIDKV